MQSFLVSLVMGYMRDVDGVIGLLLELYGNSLSFYSKMAWCPLCSRVEQRKWFGSSKDDEVVVEEGCWWPRIVEVELRERLVKENCLKS